MSDAKRSQMLDSLSGESQLLAGKYSESDRAAAETFVRDNLSESLPEALFQQTVDDVLAMNPAAWTAWLKSGSKEDWASYVGVLDLPTLIVAGTRDQALGPEAQREHTLPHFSRGRLAEVECSHLIPLERPKQLAALIASFIDEMDSGACL